MVHPDQGHQHGPPATFLTGLSRCVHGTGPGGGSGGWFMASHPHRSPPELFWAAPKNRSDTVAEAVWSVRGGCVSLWGCPKPSLEANPGSGMQEGSCGSLAFKCSVDFSTFRSSHNWRSPGPTGGLKGTQRQSLTNVWGLAAVVCRTLLGVCACLGHPRGKPRWGGG